MRLALFSLFFLSFLGQAFGQTSPHFVVPIIRSHGFSYTGEALNAANNLLIFQHLPHERFVHQIKTLFPENQIPSFSLYLEQLNLTRRYMPPTTTNELKALYVDTLPPELKKWLASLEPRSVLYRWGKNYSGKTLKEIFQVPWRFLFKGLTQEEELTPLQAHSSIQSNMLMSLLVLRQMLSSNTFILPETKRDLAAIFNNFKAYLSKIKPVTSPSQTRYSRVDLSYAETPQMTLPNGIRNWEQLAAQTLYLQNLLKTVQELCNRKIVVEGQEISSNRFNPKETEQLLLLQLQETIKINQRFRLGGNVKTLLFANSPEILDRVLSAWGNPIFLKRLPENTKTLALRIIFDGKNEISLSSFKAKLLQALQSQYPQWFSSSFSIRDLENFLQQNNTQLLVGLFYIEGNFTPAETKAKLLPILGFFKSPHAHILIQFSHPSNDFHQTLQEVSSQIPFHLTFVKDGNFFQSQ